jgi:hypothetical protein
MGFRARHLESVGSDPLKAVRKAVRKVVRKAVPKWSGKQSGKQSSSSLESSPQVVVATTELELPQPGF